MRGDVLNYVAWRIIHSIPLVIGVFLIGFGIMHLAPGGPLAVYTLNPTITVTDIERIRTALGLDQPIHLQYLSWAKAMITGSWGFTFFGGRAVLEVIVERLPATMILMGTSLSLAIVIGTAIGMLGAVRRNSIFDYLATAAADQQTGNEGTGARAGRRIVAPGRAATGNGEPIPSRIPGWPAPTRLHRARACARA
jgi:peptide/nickel transport system permease protein